MPEDTMGAELSPQGLAEAQSRIIHLLDDLNETVESAHRLERIGYGAIAIRLIDEQRGQLDDFVRTVAAAVAPRRRFAMFRRPALATFAMLVIAAGSALIGLNHGAREDLDARLERVTHISDPAARINGLKDVYAVGFARGATRNVAFRSSVGIAARRAIEDMRRNGHVRRDVVDDARALAHAAESGAPPASGPAQSLGESPVHSVVTITRKT